MKKIIVVSVALFGFMAFIVASGVTAEKKTKAQLADEKAKAKAKVEQQALVSLAKKTEAVTKAKEVLAAREWTVEVTPKGEKGAQGKSEMDILTFTLAGTLSSNTFSGQGYKVSNITVTPQEDGTIVWETMQMTEKGDVAFWRGELRNDTMSGLISLQPQQNVAREFIFKSLPLGQAATPVVPEKLVAPEKPKKVEKPAKAAKPTEAVKK